MSIIKKIFSSFLFIFPLFFFIFIPHVRAADEFSVDTIVTYSVGEDGKTKVTHEVTLVNNLSDVYATTYTLSLENINVESVHSENSSGLSYPVDIQKEDSKTNIKVNFSDVIVGRGSERHFFISYINTEFALRTGEVWEVSIPRMGKNNNFRSYQVNLNVPKSFGLEAYISPNPASSKITDTGYVYTFTREQISDTGVSAGFGEFQVFTFNLSYHLENPLPRSTTAEIALPPDTAFQKVYLQKLDPKPTNITVDQDGNWIAVYELSPSQRVDVVAIGSVQIFASYRSFPKPKTQTLNDDLSETEYWQVNDPAIKELAAKLKTPKAIYDYVTKTLHYDTERVQPNVQRMGAVAALQSPNKAICMEFTDLFVAIARAAGIPAREINGYAYTENPDLQPLGLVADVLHAWPEYYDKDKGVWIPVDPTWGSTTGGVDFFNKLDLRHFAFVIHGKSPREPYPPGSYKLGPNPQKDVFVSFGTLPDTRISVPTVSITPFRVLPFFSSIYTATISNPGPASLYGISPVIYYDSVEKARETIEVLPPFSKNQIQITLKHNFLGKDMPSTLKVSVGTAYAQTLTNKKSIVIDSLIIISIVLLIILLLMLIKFRKINLLAPFAKIKATKKNTYDNKPNTEPPQETDKT